ncbi:hypothetical protein EW026_g3715 [Hermanssonia centrifuga]|uniref:Non-structural maintenance of chromosomes element 4 n=1 Tax=Hermanssonia centrifuga TaxID=98765 RepID=A0A4S4KKI2_9APHY|nr:hypothetical protein EW026_g3715 [Hermanssonia centrifuga]
MGLNSHDDANEHLVKGPGEATLDSSALMAASMRHAVLARSMKSGGGSFDVDDFVSKLIIFMGGRHSVEEMPEDDEYDDNDDGNGAPLDWERIGWKAVAKSHRVPVMDFMLGPLSIEQKQRAVGKRSKLEKDKGSHKKPQELTEDDITRSENETTKNVANLERILEEQGKPINLFRFIINPNDFGQSVENLFYLSFLIRDAKCSLDLETGEPILMLCEQPTADDYDGGELKKHQLVMELDMPTWRRAIEVFNIRQSTIPHRPKSEMRIGEKWYG